MLDNTSTSYQEFTSITISKRTPNILNTIAKETFAAYGKQVKLFEVNLGLGYVNGTDYGSTNDEEMYCLIPTSDKGYACVGFTNGYGATNTDIYFIKTDSNLVGSTSIVSVFEYANNTFDVKIFPNPCISELNIISESNFKELPFKLFDQIGREINISNKIYFLSQNKIKINFGELSKGIYFLNFGNRTEKIIIGD